MDIDDANGIHTYSQNRIDSCFFKWGYQRWKRCSAFEMKAFSTDICFSFNHILLLSCNDNNAFVFSFTNTQMLTHGRYSLKEAQHVSSWGKIFISDPFFVLCHQSISISSCLNPYIARKNIWEGNLRRGKIHFGSRFQRFQSMASGLHYCGPRWWRPPWKQEHNLE